MQNSSSILLASYHDKIMLGKIVSDPHQQPILKALQQLYTQLQESKPLLLYRIAQRLKLAPVKAKNKGLYVWGGVGRGKTFLMNLFYQYLPQQKMRLHFHRFMQLVHEQLAENQHKEDPLRSVADYFSERASVLCLDEVNVTDITDAMILSRLLHHLYRQNIVMVMTSNLAPDDLYPEGLQREQFLPAIQLIHQYNKVIQMTGELDYRQNLLAQTMLYYVPADARAEQQLQRIYRNLSGVDLHQERTDIIINQRSIWVKKWSDNIVWFEFTVICGNGRSTEDYLQIATYFSTIIISNIPCMDDQRLDELRRFINMIDIYYDKQIKLIVSADARPELLYLSGELVTEYQRTQSRLLEMQSTQY